MPLDLPVAHTLWTPKPAIIRPAGDLNRHDRRAMEKEFGVRFPASEAILTGMVPIIPRSNPAVLTFTVAAGNNANQDSYTFAGHNIGPASVDRIVVVAAFTASVQPAGVTVGGVTATKIQGDNASLWMALVPASVIAGTAADVVVSATSASSCAIGVWNLRNYLSATPFDSFYGPQIAGAGTSYAGDIGVPINGVFVAAGLHGSTANVFAWSGVTGRFDAATDGVRYSGADFTQATPATTQAFSVAYSSSSFRNLNGAVWR